MLLRWLSRFIRIPKYPTWKEGNRWNYPISLEKHLAILYKYHDDESRTRHTDVQKLELLMKRRDSEYRKRIAKLERKVNGITSGQTKAFKEIETKTEGTSEIRDSEVLGDVWEVSPTDRDRQARSEA